MSKQVNPQELAELVTKLLTNPDSVGELDTPEKFSAFMTDIARVVCDHCGGEVRHEASRDGEAEEQWLVGVNRNDSLPEDSDGVWAGVDPEGEL